MKIRLSFMNRLMNNNDFLKLLSIAIAVLFWFIVIVNISPDYTRTITGVPVTIDESNGFLQDSGLHAVDKSAAKVSVKVSGPRDVIGRLGANDFRVTPDIGSVSKSGKYTLNLVTTLKKTDSRVKIEKTSSTSIDVNFDTLASKTVPVKINVKNSKVADGYIMQSATAKPGQIVVSGPSSEVDQVASARSDVDVDSNAKDTFSSKCDITLYDSKNLPLSLKHIKTDYSSVSVTVPILKNKQVPLTVDFSNVPAGFDTANIQYTINPSSMNIAGKSGEVESVSKINLSTIDFNTLDLTNSFSMGVTLPGNIKNIDSLSTVSVSVNLLKTTSKVVSSNAFQVINAPAGYGIRVRTKQVNGIKLFGPTSEINSVTGVTAVIDMSSIDKETGQYEIPVSISVPGKTGFWATGSYSAVIQVWKK